MTVISMCLTLGVNLLASTADIQLFYQYTIGEPVWIYMSYMYLCITLVLLTDLYMHLVYPCVESEAVFDWVCALKQIETLSRV